MAANPLISIPDSVLVLVDMQTAFRDKIVGFAEIVAVQKKLVAIARELDVPIVVTEHYSKGLGRTLPELVDALGGEPDADGSVYRPIEKIAFSAFGCEEFREAIDRTGRKSLVVAGIESHICILQTALEGAAAGFDVHVVPDAISARNAPNHEFALEKLRRYRVELDTWEMVTYQWLRQAGTPEFKRILPFIK